MAIVLAEYCPSPIDVGHVLRLLTVHDLVEVYAGDTQIYDDEAVKGQAERESLAAAKLFGLLPADQASSMEGLWREFEEQATEEARFARAIDTLAPTWLHWGDHATPPAEPLTVEQIVNRKGKVLEPYPELYAVLLEVIQSARSRELIQ